MPTHFAYLKRITPGLVEVRTGFEVALNQLA